MKSPLTAATVALATTAVMWAQVPPRSAKEGVYTTEQAGRGKSLYESQCASCHGSMAAVTPDMAPLLNDSGFQNLWRERSLAQLFGRIRETMPQDKPNTLSPDETASLVAYILSGNQLPAGTTALPVDLELLKEIRVDAGEP
jgi:mono/diheme cytochrome c family protein